MLPRRTTPLALIVALAAAAPCAAGEKFTTENFVVDAPTKELARTFGEYAEKYRSEKALDWLGYEMPRWPQRCPLKVTVTMNQTGGATTFTFGPGPDGRSQVTSREMKIFGETSQLLNSVLPHEVTHTVLAHHFGQPVPRWADEGGSVLSENDKERYEHDVKCREMLNQGRGIPVRVLFTLKEYPKDMIVVYAQGYSLCQYLIDKGGKQRFLQFVGQGMKNDNRNWEQAVQMYGYSSTDELQEAWIDSLRTPPSRTIAARGLPKDRDRAPAGELASRKGPSETRTSALSGLPLPLLEPPVVARGAAPDREAAKPTSTSGARPPVVKLGAPEPPTR